jgi:transposase
MIARVIEEEFGVQYQLGHVRKFLHGLGFSVQWPRRVSMPRHRTNGTAASIPPLKTSPLATLDAHLYR